MFADRARMAAAGRSAEGGNDSYTKLLMHMEGTDDAQVFTDSSIGNLVKSDPGTGFSDAFGVFDGTGDYLSLADHADWDLVADTTDYTVEFWVKHTDHAGTETYITQYEDVDNNWMIYHVHGTGIYFNVQSGAGSVIQINSGDEIVDNEWHHIALSKDATVYTLFLDGVDIGTTTDASTDTFAGALLVGSDGTNAFAGSIDEVRISNVDRYTSGFTPQTANHSNDGNTLLLLHMDMPNTDPESFTDSSTTGHTVTQNGNAYQKARNLGIIGTSCGYFDGTGDYLSITDSADWDLFGDAGDATIEFWVYHPVSQSEVYYIDQWESATDRWQIDSYGGIGTRFKLVQAGSNIVELTASKEIGTNPGTWQHVALVKDATVYKLYIDGIEEGTTTDASTDTFAGSLSIGQYGGGSTRLNGYMDELRISDSARYTANFNPPTTAFSDDANTFLLLHFDAGEGVVAVTDSSTGGAGSPHTANITENGNFIQVIGHGADAVADVKTENTQKKFGTTSAYFDGTGDYITLAYSTDYAFGDGDFTIDFWFYATSLPSNGVLSVFMDQYEDVNNRMLIGIYNNAGTYQCQLTHVYSGDNSLNLSDDFNVNLSTNTWYHLALVRNGTSTNMYQDGVGFASEVDAATWGDIGASLRIGRYESPTYEFAGYIDELRISKGIARWTANFTPPNAAYYE